MENRAEARISLKAIKENAYEVMKTLSKGCRMLAVVRQTLTVMAPYPLPRHLWSLGLRILRWLLLPRVKK